MIKKAIRSILWRTGLSRSIPPLFWKAVSKGDNIKMITRKDRKIEFPVSFEDDTINNSFKIQNELFAQVKDYVLEVSQTVLIEPVCGIGILGNGMFLQETRNHPYIYPSTWNYLKYKLKLASTIYLDGAVHFDGYEGDNYYNFFGDVLSAFCWGIKNGMPSGLPLIIGKQVYTKSYFQWLLKNNEWFRSLNWQVLDGKTYIQVKKLYKASVLLQKADVWLDAASLYRPPHVANPEKRIFLNRSPKTGRCLSNLEVVTPILKKYGFEIVDSAAMTIEEQIHLFANTRYLIAIHGAGITNIIFANTEKLSLLELLPGQMLNTHYYWMAATFGCPYDAILGGLMNSQRQFRMEPEILEHHIQKMLSLTVV